MEDVSEAMRISFLLVSKSFEDTAMQMQFTH
jgi:hypothetical protein